MRARKPEPTRSSTARASVAKPARGVPVDTWGPRWRKAASAKPIGQLAHDYLIHEARRIEVQGAPQAGIVGRELRALGAQALAESWTEAFAVDFLSTYARTAEIPELGAALNLCAIGIRHGAHRGAPAIVVAEPPNPTRRIAIVGCSAKKLDRPGPAREFYTSALFRASLAYAEATCDEVWIASAKYGLVRLDQVLTPYDLDLRSFSKSEREAWGVRTIARLAADASNARLVVIAGETYGYPLAHGAHWRGMKKAERPLRGIVGVGPRIAWLRERTPASSARVVESSAAEPSTSTPRARIGASSRELEAPATSAAKPSRVWTGDGMHENGCTYQHELIRCGKAVCVCMRRGKLHGPYWYGYARHEGGKTRSWYVGKSLDDPRKPPPWEREEPRRARAPRRAAKQAAG